MTNSKMWQSLNATLHNEMRLDPSIVLFGEDVASAGGTFGVTRKLAMEFGKDRVFDTPITEQCLIGMAAGAALGGLRPIVEILFADFLLLGSDALVNQAAKMRYFSGDKVNIPMTIRVGVGTGRGMGGQHSQNLEGWFAGVPGLKVVWPSTAASSASMLRAAIRDPGPVVVFESVQEYPRIDTTIPEATVGIGDSITRRNGDDITLVTWGGAVRVIDQVAEQMGATVSCEVIDLVSLAPWDVESVVASVNRTGRCLVIHNAITDFGPGAEIACTVNERSFASLRGPVRRVGSPRVTAPQTKSLEELRLPSAEGVVEAIRSMTSV